MKTDFNCIPCILQQTIETVQIASEDHEVRQQTINEVLKYLQKINYSDPPPLLGKHISDLIYKVTGNNDPYREIKHKINHLALSFYDDLRKIVFQNPDPILTAAKLAVAGNIIDFADNDDEIHLRRIIEQIHDLNFEINHIDKFIKDILKSKKVLYLADNAGEIVFDRLFIEMLQRYYPERSLKFTVIVRGAPIINDATLEDAKMVGLDKIAKVIDNGDYAPAMVLSDISKQARVEYENADIVISKGQGNYETLDTEPRLIYYLLKIKCPVISNVIKAQIGNLVFKRNENYKD
ncbi:MAG: DUF89 domain-containing protein [Calditrichaceae bacterium]